MEIEQQIEMAMRYRSNLLKYGKRVTVENPDKLNNDEMTALSEKIFSELNRLDMSFGYPYHEVGISVPKSITKDRQEELFGEFVDWYQVIDTPSEVVYRYVVGNYNPEKHPRILCVGDGENCHLGRKLAMAGYNVVSVDPVAKKQFATNRNNGSNEIKGSLRIVTGQFLENSEDMVNWADVIVGSKVPLCAEALVGQNKPAIFNISANVEIYNMKFKGKPISSSEELIDEIKKCPGVKMKKWKSDTLGICNILFVCNERQRTEESR